MILRRFLTLVALIFWQGGFTFYAAVVVPIGQRVLGSHLEQGFITREVTWYMNIAGAVALAVLAGDLLASSRTQLLVRLRWASTFEWVFGWIYIWLMLKSWKWEDQQK
jgi:hypothetical protein